MIFAAGCGSGSNPAAPSAGERGLSGGPTDHELLDSGTEAINSTNPDIATGGGVLINDRDRQRRRPHDHDGPDVTGYGASPIPDTGVDGLELSANDDSSPSLDASSDLSAPDMNRLDASPEPDSGDGLDTSANENSSPSIDVSNDMSTPDTTSLNAAPDPDTGDGLELNTSEDPAATRPEVENENGLVDPSTT